MGGGREAPASRWWKRAPRPALLGMLLPGLCSCLVRVTVPCLSWDAHGHWTGEELNCRILGPQVQVSRTRHLLGYLGLVTSAWGGASSESRGNGSFQKADLSFLLLTTCGSKETAASERGGKGNLPWHPGHALIRDLT